jgi:hypothetical protein
MERKMTPNQKTTLQTILIILFITITTTPLQALTGQGTQSNPYKIQSLTDFNDFANNPNYWAPEIHTRLETDINLASQTYTTAVIAPDMNNTNTDIFDGTPFSGIFDGNDHIISNLTINTETADNDYLALFGQIRDPNASIKKLNIEDCSIIGRISFYLGIVCGDNKQGTIINCRATGSVISGDYSWYLSGLCGYNSGLISDSHVNISIRGKDMSSPIGGLCGANYGTITDCYATGSVTGTGMSGGLGGLCGSNRGNITNCYATTSVTGGCFYQEVGGLCGSNYSGTTANCYATGTVTAGNYTENLGGLCGANYSSTITNCYATGAISGDCYSENFGGLCGLSGLCKSSSRSTITNCYSIVTINVGDNSRNSGGLCGYNHKATIIDCFAVSKVIGGQASGCLGGFSGVNQEGVITNCYAEGSITGGQDSLCLGGFSGGNSGVITNCYANTKLTADNSSRDLGGFCGANNGTINNSYSIGMVACGDDSRRIGGLSGGNAGHITNCYAANLITADSNSTNIGGLCGTQFRGSINYSFWDKEKSGTSVGYNLDPSYSATITNVVGKTTAEMQSMSTYTDAGWDFDWYNDGDPADWFIQINEYPILTWQISPADLYTDGRNNAKDFALFAQFWQRNDCSIYNDYCDYADQDFNGNVDIFDLIELANHWLTTGIYN